MGATLSKTALWKKINQSLLEILQDSLSSHIQQSGLSYLQESGSENLFSAFRQVFLQDSTILSLPDELHPYYKGQSKADKPKSKLRVQLIYNFITGCFADVALQGYCDNDQKDSGRILKFVQPGDLVVRDLGYFALQVFAQLAGAGAFFVSRYKLNVNLYHQRGQTLDLLELFAQADKRGQTVIDTEVLAGAEVKLPVRLVAVRLPDEVAAERKRKALENRDKRMNPSKEYLKKLEWNIFLTNVSKQVYTPQQITRVYRLRWHIEIIFKGWKSHFNFQEIIPGAAFKKEDHVQRLKLRVEIFVFLVLLYAAIFIAGIYSYFMCKIFIKSGRLLSYLKTCRYINAHFDMLMEMDTESMQANLSYYACYEKRKKRQNTISRYLNLSYISNYEDIMH